jgi:hypothetical protein
LIHIVDTVNTTYPKHSIFLIEDHPNWKDLYPDSEEEIPNDLPKSKEPKILMTVNIDADHAHDLVTRISKAGILLMLNCIPIR